MPNKSKSNYLDKQNLLWDLTKLSQPPKTFAASEFQDKNNIKGIFYEGPLWHEKSTKIFAWIGLPKMQTSDRVPGIVLVHGGGGTAFHDWVKLWNDRGYAAIAMDTCGCTPKGENSNWQKHPNGGPSGNGGFNQIDEPEQDQWPFQAVSAVILANSILRSLPEVDENKIGITGISWGGFLTCIASSVDNRFTFAAPVYGCGFLGYNSDWIENFNTMGQQKAEKWLKIWDPSVYLPQNNLPMLWVTGTNDFAFPMNSLRKSYNLPNGKRYLSIKVRMPHGHGGPGETPEEIHAFANEITASTPTLSTFKNQGIDIFDAWTTFSSPTDIIRAELNFTKDLGIWKERKWATIPATIDKTNSLVKAKIPIGTQVYFFNITNKNNLTFSSEHIEL